MDSAKKLGDIGNTAIVSQQIHNRPADPFISKNAFRFQEDKTQALPTLDEARSQLPVPLLEDWPEWVEMYWRAWDLTWSQLHRPRPGSALISHYLKAPAADTIFMDESAFAIHYGIYGRRVFDASSLLDNFYARQHRDGFICREIAAKSGLDMYHPFDPDSTGPNILAWSEWRYYRSTGEDERLHKIFWPLLAYHRWLRANRTWPNGLYWATGVSSGMDNQEQIPNGKRHHNHWTWVDATMQAALNISTLSQIAATIGEGGIGAELVDEHLHLLRSINSILWNDEIGFYQDVSPTGKYCPVKSLSAYWALHDKDITTPERLERFLGHLRDGRAFKRLHRVPSQSANDEGYTEAGDHCQGGVWSTLNYMLLRGLRSLEQHALAHEIAFNHLEIVSQVLRNSGSFWAFYSPETAAPGLSSEPEIALHAGITAVAILLEDIIGLSVDWPRRRILWDRRLNTESIYGVRNYPLGQVGTVDLFGDSEICTVRTTVPFTLMIQSGEKRMQIAVQEGEQQIQL